jgi:hypothetical protein
MKKLLHFHLLSLLIFHIFFSSGRSFYCIISLRFPSIFCSSFSVIHIPFFLTLYSFAFIKFFPFISFHLLPSIPLKKNFFLLSASFLLLFSFFSSVMQDGLANICLVTTAMTITKAKIERKIPKKDMVRCTFDIF